MTQEIEPLRIRLCETIDFVIITALEEERDAVLNKLHGYRQLPPAEDDIRTYFQADLPVTFPDNSTGIYRVVVMCLLGMGRVQAVTATADAIRQWRPRYILLIGIAGGLASRNVEIGDILISEQVADYELQKITNNKGTEIRWKIQNADPRLLNACINFRNSDWEDLIQVERPGPGQPIRKIGTIASGDKVIAFDQILEKYSSTWPKLIGVEMEAGGVATASFQATEKPGFFMVRGVSDLADENKDLPDGEKWRSYACDVAASYAISLLKSGPVLLSTNSDEEKTRQVALVFEAEFDFTSRSKQDLVNIVAGYLQIDPRKIKILETVQGSIDITMQMPDAAAKRLHSLATTQDENIARLGIKSIWVEGSTVIDLADKDTSTNNAFRKSVLVVENDRAWKVKLTKILTRDDEFDVVCVSSLREARQLIESNASLFHIVVLDIILDGKDWDNVDGFILLDEMQKLKYPARTIILDHHPDSIERFKHALGLKAFDYFDKTPPNKPFNEFGFLEAVQKATEQSGVIDVFAIMPFDPKYWNFYENAIKATFEEMNLSCKRSDEIFHQGVIMKDILRYVRHAKFIVADLSGGNLNVLFEIGLAHAIQKPVILLTRNLDDVPALIQDNIQVFNYDVTLPGGDKLHNHLMDAARKIQIGQSPVILAELNADLDKTLCLGLVPKYQSEKSNAFTYIIKHVAERELGFSAKHLEEITGSGSVIEKGWEYVNRARIIIADLTRHDSRVYYWSGVTYGLEKDLVTLAKKGEEIPFDLRGVHRIEYSMDFGKGSDARENLRNAMRLLLEQKITPDDVKPHANTSQTRLKGSKTKSKVQKKGSTLSRNKTPTGGNVMKNRSSRVKVFINHATEDKPLVRRLHFELKKFSWIDIWIDEERLLPGQELGLEIDKAMEQADAVLVCMSETSIKKKGYVQAEIRKAEEQQRLRPQGVIYMIPVLLESCKDFVPPSLQKLLWVDISDPGKIVSIIKSLETLRK